MAFSNAVTEMNGLPLARSASAAGYEGPSFRFTFTDGHDLTIGGPLLQRKLISLSRNSAEFA